MTSLLFLAPVLLGGPADAEFNMKLTVNGKPAGTVNVRKHLDAQGSLTETAHLHLHMGSMTDEMVNVSVYDRNGRPIKETESHASAGQKGTIAQVFGKDRVTVTASMNGQSRSFDVPIPKGNINDPSNFWFLTTKPKVGTRVDYLKFDLRSRKWQTRYSVYSGDEIVPGTRIKAHAIKGAKATDWVDDRGRSVRTEDHRNAGTDLIAVRDGR